MYYREKLYSLKTLIEIAIELNNELCKLAIKIWYSEMNNKIKFYFRYRSYYSKQKQTNK